MENKFEEKDIDLRQIINHYLRYKFWFLISVIACFLIVICYLAYKKPIYSAVSEVVINSGLYKDQTNKDLAEAVSNFTFTTSNISIDEQVNFLKSRDLIKNLSIETGLFLNDEIVCKYGKFPKNKVVIYLSKVRYNEFLSKKELNLPFLLKNVNVSNYGERKHSYLYPMKNEKGQINYTLITFSFDEFDRDIFNKSIDKILSNLSINKNGDKATHLLQISYSDLSREMSEFTLGQIFKQYNRATKDSVNKINNININFIEERVFAYKKDLDKIENDISNFKSQNNISTETQIGNIVWNSKIELENNINRTDAILQNIENIIVSLNKNSNEVKSKNESFNLITYHANINNNVLESLITDYNKNITKYFEEKKYLTSNEIEYNKKLIDEQRYKIKDVLKQLQSGFNNSKKLDNTLLRNFQYNVVKSEKDVSLVDKTIKQKKIIEELYLYLLKKLEEEKIRVAKDFPSLSVINSPYASSNPVAPKKQILFLGAFIIGLLVPVGYIELKKIMDNTIKNKADLDSWFKGSFLGYIPKLRFRDQDITISIEKLYSNLEFLLPNRKGGKVVFVTSAVANEGKTFVSYHLAKVISEQNKRVLLIGADLRSPKLLDYIGEIQNRSLDHKKNEVQDAGLSGFLMENDDNINHFIIKNPNGFKFSLMKSGAIPPNPAELLTRSSFKKLIAEAKDHYDYVIFDTAPVGILSDTINISKYADATLYVLRSNFSDKDNNEVLMDMIENNKLNNIGVVINDYDRNKNDYYYYNY